MKNQVVNFFHIEKCGGDTMRDILARQYSSKDTFSIVRSKEYEENRQYLLKVGPEWTEWIKLVVGHQHYGIHKCFPENSMKYFTMLRHPVPRMVSCYYSYRRKSDAPLHEAANQLTLNEFVESKVKLHMDNGMTRVLCDAWPDEPAYGKITEKHFKEAKRNLSKVLVGITENYNASLIYFQGEFGWSLPLYTKANFAKTKPSPIDLDLRDAILKHNKYDLKLYYHAKLLFEEATSRDGFQRKVQRFEFLNSIIGRFYVGARLKRLIKRRLG